MLSQQRALIVGRIVITHQSALAESTPSHFSKENNQKAVKKRAQHSSTYCHSKLALNSEKNKISADLLQKLSIMKGEKAMKRPSFDIRIVVKQLRLLLKFGSCGQK
jgi:hypothetical protein